MLKIIEARNAQREADKSRLRMQLQYFAEDPESNPDDGSDDGGEGGSDDGSGGDDDPESGSDDGKTFTQEELTNIVQREKAKAKKQAEKDAETLAEEKAQEKLDEAEKLKNMNDDEREEYENQKLKDELAELKRERALAHMGKEATTMLAEKNIKANDDILAFVVNEDAEQTSENVKKFVYLIEAQRENIREEFNKKLGGRMPLGGNSETESLSEAAKLAKQRNKQTKSNPDAPNPWAVN